MVIRATPEDITKYWIVNDSQENLILQENNLMPRFMDTKFTYYLLDKEFIDKYLILIDKYSLLSTRKSEMQTKGVESC